MSSARNNSFGILMYHRIAPWTEGTPRPTWNVTPDQFRRQLAGLLSRGYQPWPLRRALAAQRAGQPVPRRAFVVTFDDGYENVYSHAWPILKELSVPATVFIVTSYLDTNCVLPFDDWTAAGSDAVPADAWRPLGARQCAEMLEHGLIEIGSHTHTHGNFLGRIAAFRGDLNRSLAALRDRFGVAQAPFAFPYGCCDLELAEIVRQSGATCALTTEPRLVSPCVDPFWWGRFNVSANDTATTLTLKLGGWYSILRDAWRCARLPWRIGCALIRQQAPRPRPIATPNRTVPL
jgi:peptidoglycan/xylan/chitin deacetylase (PgdA/CDA1 family)